MAKTRTIKPGPPDDDGRGKKKGKPSKDTRNLDARADWTPDDAKADAEANPEPLGGKRMQALSEAEREFLNQLDALLYGKPIQHVHAGERGPRSLDVRKLAAMVWTPRDVALAKLRISRLAGILPDPETGHLLDGAVDETVQLRALMHIDMRVLGRAGTTDIEDPPPAEYAIDGDIAEALKHDFDTSAAGFVAQSQASARGHASPPVSGGPDGRPVHGKANPKGPRSK